MKLKTIIFTILFVTLFYLSLFIAGFIPFIAENMTEFSSEVVLNYTKDIIIHPIENIKQMHAAGNPILYVSTGAAFILFIYLLYKTRKKNYENVGERYGVQGSARLAKNAEIFNVPNQITIVPSKNMYAELRKTLNNNEVKK
ncbi:hypothetical protein MPH61_23275 [Peribacillus muralis]|uniref:hypothetical protein n=1 Tax=Peribacillus muralis TaxID=264697 RepID=UPI001F4EBEA8|nr:hypothetical protein [Peribacillus muralis]MCK1995447.1 hypothetical protein [Peribacillus muralis]MCK2016030.1 hypothetical protein [Peribacillus muralis]